MISAFYSLKQILCPKRSTQPPVQWVSDPLLGLIGADLLDPVPILTMGGASGDSSVSIVTRLCVGCARNGGSISGTGKVSIPKLRIGSEVYPAFYLAGT